MAYSLFTKEELPFALDLHLFLGRRLLPAPRASIAAAAAASGEGGAQQDTSLYGTFPLVRRPCEGTRTAPPAPQPTCVDNNVSILLQALGVV